MKVIEKYILKDFLKTYFYCLAIFISMYIIMDILGHIEEIVKEKVALSDLALYYGSFLPFIFVNTSPIAMLLATVFVLGNLNRRNEITAMKASGISIFKILKPLIIFGLLMSAVIFVINEEVVTKSNLISSEIKEKKIRKKPKKEPPKSIKNVAAYGKGNLIIFAKLFNREKNVLVDVIMHEHDHLQQLKSKRIMPKVRWRDDVWVGHNVTHYTIDNAGFIEGVPQFREREILPIKENPEDFTKKQSQAEFMNYAQLKNYIERFSGAQGAFINQLLVDLYYRVSFPFINFIIIIVGAPFALYSHRGGTMIGFGYSVIITLVYYSSMAVSMAFGKAGFLPPLISVWFVHVVFFSTGIILLRKRS